METGPTLSFLAIEGWACSNGLFNLGKRWNSLRETETNRGTRHRKQNYNVKILPHGKNNPPIGPSTSRPRATPRRDPGLLLGRRGPRLHTSRLASTEASAPTASFPLT